MSGAGRAYPSTTATTANGRSVYAAIIGRILLEEELTAHRIAPCVASAMGAACLAD